MVNLVLDSVSNQIRSDELDTMIPSFVQKQTIILSAGAIDFDNWIKDQNDFMVEPDESEEPKAAIADLRCQVLLPYTMKEPEILSMSMLDSSVQTGSKQKTKAGLRRMSSPDQVRLFNKTTKRLFSRKADDLAKAEK